jgi:hypothetical protein
VVFVICPISMKLFLCFIVGRMLLSHVKLVVWNCIDSLMFWKLLGHAIHDSTDVNGSFDAHRNFIISIILNSPVLNFRVAYQIFKMQLPWVRFLEGDFVIFRPKVGEVLIFWLIFIFIIQYFYFKKLQLGSIVKVLFTFGAIK